MTNEQWFENDGVKRADDVTPGWDRESPSLFGNVSSSLPGPAAAELTSPEKGVSEYGASTLVSGPTEFSRPATGRSLYEPIRAEDQGVNRPGPDDGKSLFPAGQEKLYPNYRVKSLLDPYSTHVAFSNDPSTRQIQGRGLTGPGPKDGFYATQGVTAIPKGMPYDYYSRRSTSLRPEPDLNVAPAAASKPLTAPQVPPTSPSPGESIAKAMSSIPGWGYALGGAGALGAGLLGYHHYNQQQEKKKQQLSGVKEAFVGKSAGDLSRDEMKEAMAVPPAEVAVEAPPDFAFSGEKAVPVTPTVDQPLPPGATLLPADAGVGKAEAYPIKDRFSRDYMPQHAYQDFNNWDPNSSGPNRSIYRTVDPYSSPVFPKGNDGTEEWLYRSPPKGEMDAFDKLRLGVLGVGGLGLGAYGVKKLLNAKNKKDEGQKKAFDEGVTPGEDQAVSDRGQGGVAKPLGDLDHSTERMHVDLKTKDVSLRRVNEHTEPATHKGMGVVDRLRMSTLRGQAAQTGKDEFGRSAFYGKPSFFQNHPYITAGALGAIGLGGGAYLYNQNKKKEQTKQADFLYDAAGDASRRLVTWAQEQDNKTRLANAGMDVGLGMLAGSADGVRGAYGMARAPKGYLLQSGLRGGLIGAGTAAGATAGGVLHSLYGSPEDLSANLALRGAGALIGGFGTSKLLGPPSYELDKERLKNHPDHTPVPAKKEEPSADDFMKLLMALQAQRAAHQKQATDDAAFHRAGAALGLGLPIGIPAGALIGGLRGALTAPHGKRLEGARHGAKLGVGIGAGAAIGTAAGHTLYGATHDPEPLLRGRLSALDEGRSPSSVIMPAVGRLGGALGGLVTARSLVGPSPEEVAETEKEKKRQAFADTYNEFLKHHTELKDAPKMNKVADSSHAVAHPGDALLYFYLGPKRAAEVWAKSAAGAPPSQSTQDFMRGFNDGPSPSEQANVRFVHDYRSPEVRVRPPISPEQAERAMAGLGLLTLDASSPFVGAGVGTIYGAATAPDGKRLQSTAKGLGVGLGAGIGSVLGAGTHAALGGDYVDNVGSGLLARGAGALGGGYLMHKLIGPVRGEEDPARKEAGLRTLTKRSFGEEFQKRVGEGLKSLVGPTVNEMATDAGRHAANAANSQLGQNFGDFLGRNNWATGALVGGGIGAGLGALNSVTSRRKGNNLFNDVLLGGGLGAGAGGLAGVAYDAFRDKTPPVATGSGASTYSNPLADAQTGPGSALANAATESPEKLKALNLTRDAYGAASTLHPNASSAGRPTTELVDDAKALQAAAGNPGVDAPALRDAANKSLASTRATAEDIQSGMPVNHRALAGMTGVPAVYGQEPNPLNAVGNAPAVLGGIGGPGALGLGLTNQQAAGRVLGTAGETQTKLNATPDEELAAHAQGQTPFYSGALARDVASGGVLGTAASMAARGARNLGTRMQVGAGNVDSSRMASGLIRHVETPAAAARGTFNPVRPVANAVYGTPYTAQQVANDPGTLSRIQMHLNSQGNQTYTADDVRKVLADVGKSGVIPSDLRQALEAVGAGKVPATSNLDGLAGNRTLVDSTLKDTAPVGAAEPTNVDRAKLVDQMRGAAPMPDRVRQSIERSMGGTKITSTPAGSPHPKSIVRPYPNTVQFRTGSPAAQMGFGTHLLRGGLPGALYGATRNASRKLQDLSLAEEAQKRLKSLTP